MPLLTRYSHLKKKEPAGGFRLFEPLRAVGLALEKGLKLARAKGLGQVSASDLETVAVGGSLQVLQEGVWQPQKRTLLALRGQDSELSSALLQEVRSYLHQKGFCPSEVDLKVPGMRCHLDLLGDCISSSPLFVKGKLWVELKVCTKETVGRNITKTSEQLAALLPKVQQKMPQVEAVLLVCAVVEKDGVNWGHTAFVSKLLGKDGWQEVSGGARVSRGRLSLPFDLCSLWQKMEWLAHPSGSGSKVGLLKSFLEHLKLPGGNAGKRAAGLNQQLRASGRPERLFRGKVGKAGSKPWLGSKATFRQVHNFL